MNKSFEIAGKLACLVGFLEERGVHDVACDLDVDCTCGADSDDPAFDAGLDDIGCALDALAERTPAFARSLAQANASTREIASGHVASGIELMRLAANALAIADEIGPRHARGCGAGGTGRLSCTCGAAELERAIGAWKVAIAAYAEQMQKLWLGIPDEERIQ